VLLVFGVGGLLAAELVAVYLLVVDRAFGMNSNELFAGQAIPDRRDFLRLRLQPDGTLTVYPIGLSRVPRRWDRRPDWVPGDRERFVPVDGELTPFLIEEPVPVPRTAQTAPVRDAQVPPAMDDPASRGVA